ncbi:DUF2809 domain-containing protein [Streptomyces sp. NPDC005395]|uniref:DUF2809 domain-containing protein n=1 Tax=unclassified Streptomyces TaxID=2593676 RepID=UPI0033A9427B
MTSSSTGAAVRDDPTRTRFAAAGAAAVIVGAGLTLRAVATGEVAKYGGDALYTLLLFALVLVVAPGTAPIRAAALALAVSWGVEFLQLTDGPAYLGGVVWILPGSRGLARTSAALSSVVNAPRCRPPPPCSCTHQTPLGSATRHRCLEPA